MNIDKIKISIGDPLYNFIGGLDGEQLEKMKAELISDNNRYGHHLLDYPERKRRDDEMWLINYRLGIL